MMIGLHSVRLSAHRSQAQTIPANENEAGVDSGGGNSDSVGLPPGVPRTRIPSMMSKSFGGSLPLHHIPLLIYVDFLTASPPIPMYTDNELAMEFLGYVLERRSSKGPIQGCRQLSLTTVSGNTMTISRPPGRANPCSSLPQSMYESYLRHRRTT